MGLGPSSRVMQGPYCALLRLRSSLADRKLSCLCRTKKNSNGFLPILLDWSLFLGKGASPLTVSQHTGTGTSLLTIQSPYSVLLPA